MKIYVYEGYFVLLHENLLLMSIQMFSFTFISFIINLHFSSQFNKGERSLFIRIPLFTSQCLVSASSRSKTETNVTVPVVIYKGIVSLAFYLNINQIYPIFSGSRWRGKRSPYDTVESSRG